MKRFIIPIICCGILLLFGSAPAKATDSELTVDAKVVSKIGTLEDGSTFVWADLKQNKKLEGFFGDVTVPVRVGFWCKDNKCTLVIPESDAIKVNVARTTFAVIVTAVTVKVMFFSQTGSSGGTVTGVGGGGGACPPACGGPAGI
ncbi:MAG: hypothetical protein WD509_00075 [Candidatus Paceibacterota bacterium]